MEHFVGLYLFLGLVAFIFLVIWFDDYAGPNGKGWL